HEIEIVGGDGDLLLLPERCVGAEVGGDGADIGQELAQRLEGGLEVTFVAALEPIELGQKGNAELAVQRRGTHAPLVFWLPQFVPAFRRRGDLLRVVADADDLHRDLWAPFVLKDRQQLGIVRRLGGRIFHDQTFAGRIEHLWRIEDRNVEGRAAPLGRLQARDLVGAQNDRLGDRGAGGAAECRGENVAVGLVPGTREGGGNRRLAFSEYP